jgi:single-strand DNA-binding protein
VAGETIITVVGNLTADPELKFTQSGAAVTSFTVASTPRTFDKASGEWKDGDALFLRCSVWRQVAENVAESLVRGSRVLVTGRLRQRSFETREGEKRTVIELEVDEIGPSLRYATTKVNKVTRDGGQQNGQGFGGQQRQQPQQQGGYVDDPWGNPNPPQQPQQQQRQYREDIQTGGMGRDFQRDARNGFADEPPFFHPRAHDEYNG